MLTLGVLSFSVITSDLTGSLIGLRRCKDQVTLEFHVRISQTRHDRSQQCKRS